MSSLIRPYSLFEDLYRPFDSFFGATSPAVRPSNGPWLPPVDITKDDAGFCIEMEVPGFNNDEVTVEAHDGVLTIHGEREQNKKTEEEGVVRQERSYGRFSRRFSLPDGTEADDINAAVKDGMLTIHIPHASPVEPKKIEVS